jgi:hypothetical protein
MQDSHPGLGVIVIGGEHRPNIFTPEHQREALQSNIPQREWHNISCVLASRLADRGPLLSPCRSEADTVRRAVGLARRSGCESLLTLTLSPRTWHKHPMRNPDLAASRGVRKDSTLPVVVVWPTEYDDGQTCKESKSGKNRIQ